ncbi:hypothetical protein [Mesobacillus subterraneus]|uniref:Uncharacterized protein n=1 Tax=Mesobacillus subterraneus TaxID=285983 RepID=A0A3R9KY46_9BACI|nr:hypothetical protein [Mesobacillus subterraneus]RSD28721.1 hypothetical protein EJA10_03865 [Mesobacillus subterraneus]
MVLLFYLILNGIILLFFIKKKKNLHILEIIAYWMVGSYIGENFSALCYMNFKTLHIPEILTHELSHFLSRNTIYPLVMVLFVDYYLTSSTWFKKSILTVVFVAILTSIEWVNHFLGVLIHVNWQFWWSPAIWFGGLASLLGFMKIFRILLFRGGEYK